MIRRQKHTNTKILLPNATNILKYCYQMLPIHADFTQDPLLWGIHIMAECSASLL